jgi:hypothetical protein
MTQLSQGFLAWSFVCASVVALTMALAAAGRAGRKTAMRLRLEDLMLEAARHSDVSGNWRVRVGERRVRVGDPSDQ